MIPFGFILALFLIYSSLNQRYGKRENMRNYLDIFIGRKSDFHHTWKLVQ